MFFFILTGQGRLSGVVGVLIEPGPGDNLMSLGGNYL
jgi:hypothetical protein